MFSYGQHSQYVFRKSAKQNDALQSQLESLENLNIFLKI